MKQLLFFEKNMRILNLDEVLKRTITTREEQKIDNPEFVFEDNLSGTLDKLSEEERKTYKVDFFRTFSGTEFPTKTVEGENVTVIEVKDQNGNEEETLQLRNGDFEMLLDLIEEEKSSLDRTINLKDIVYSDGHRMFGFVHSITTIEQNNKNVKIRQIGITFYSTNSEDADQFYYKSLEDLANGNPIKEDSEEEDSEDNEEVKWEYIVRRQAEGGVEDPDYTSENTEESRTEESGTEESEEEEDSDEENEYLNDFSDDDIMEEYEKAKSEAAKKRILAGLLTPEEGETEDNIFETMNRAWLYRKLTKRTTQVYKDAYNSAVDRLIRMYKSEIEQKLNEGHELLPFGKYKRLFKDTFFKNVWEDISPFSLLSKRETFYDSFIQATEGKMSKPTSTPEAVMEEDDEDEATTLSQQLEASDKAPMTAQERFESLSHFTYKTFIDINIASILIEKEFQRRNQVIQRVSVLRQENTVDNLGLANNIQDLLARSIDGVSPVDEDLREAIQKDKQIQKNTEKIIQLVKKRNSFFTEGETEMPVEKIEELEERILQEEKGLITLISKKKAWSYKETKDKTLVTLTKGIKKQAKALDKKIKNTQSREQDRKKWSKEKEMLQRLEEQLKDLIQSHKEIAKATIKAVTEAEKNETLPRSLSGKQRREQEKKSVKNTSGVVERVKAQSRKQKYKNVSPEGQGGLLYNKEFYFAQAMKKLKSKKGQWNNLNKLLYIDPSAEEAAKVDRDEIPSDSSSDESYVEESSEEESNEEESSEEELSEEELSEEESSED